MANLINKQEITETNQESVLNQVIEILTRYGMDAAEECEFSYEMKEGFGPDEFSNRLAQKFTVLGEMDGDWQRTLQVSIFENHSSATDEYFYTVKVDED